MNRYMQTKWSWIEGTHKVRLQLLESLNDTDLTYNPGGQNISLGALFRELGEVQYSYTQSLRTFKQDWSYRNLEVGLESNSIQLKTWFQTLDEEMKAVGTALSNEDLTKEIDRGGYAVTAEMQLDIYLQALLIFCGKVSIYLKVINKVLPEMHAFIG
ncbi:hypothetical protein [Dictyobacter arantiisoli]|uniref:Uncharacterized protein n=1 Tax=Dictyobacter arantiisoli TaxID=2014874 RepID=A0A5A5TI73_9CHLR|nr:hypothetical protein [Dictyobacter arantiisoli]GCF10709.1 hypothetical protein KDI_42730 [Dictyobacter arantiisoli]